MFRFIFKNLSDQTDLNQRQVIFKNWNKKYKTLSIAYTLSSKI